MTQGLVDPVWAFGAAAAGVVAAVLLTQIQGAPPAPIPIDHRRPWHCASQSPLDATTALDTTDTKAVVRIAVAGNDAKAQRDRLIIVTCTRHGASVP